VHISSAGLSSGWKRGYEVQEHAEEVREENGKHMRPMRREEEDEIL
jgi:hypothetical protein